MNVHPLALEVGASIDALGVTALRIKKQRDTLADALDSVSRLLDTNPACGRPSDLNIQLAREEIRYAIEKAGL